MVQLTPAPGKFGSHGKEFVSTNILQDEAVTTAKQSGASKIKRACSNKLTTNTSDDAAGILYTTTAITITKVVVYATTAISAGNCVVDVGINASDNAIVSGAAITDKTIDTVTALTIAGASVAADKMVTATIKTVSGDAGETIVVAIEYYENE